MFRKKRLNLWRAGVWLGYVAALALLVNYLLYLRYVRQLPSIEVGDHFEAIPNVDRETLSRVNTVHTERRSSFSKFSLTKPEGTVRIGCFGDSFTYGSESGYRMDYPSLLADILSQHGYKNVEVLNFGINGAGFHEAYILWDRVGRKFGLDYILLGPECFQWDRDTTFLHTSMLGARHARFILKNGEVQEIDPIGDNPLDLMQRSRRFLPYYRYLRYDLLPPCFFRALLPKSREHMKNPFYYRSGDPAAEAYETYKILLRKMAVSSRQIIFLHRIPELVELVDGLHEPNLKAVALERMNISPMLYLAHGGHFSPFGNQRIARILFALLTGQPESVMDLMDVAVPEEFPALSLPPVGRLDKYDEIGIAIDGTIVARFSEFIPGGAFPPSTNLRDYHAGSLLLPGNPKEFNKQDYFALQSEIKDGDALEFQARVGARIIKQQLGAVRLLAPGVPLGAMEFSTLECKLGECRLTFEKDNILEGKLIAPEAPADIELLLAGERIMSYKVVRQFRPEKKTVMTIFRLVPVTGMPLSLRGDREAWLDTDSLADQGFFQLFLRRQNEIRLIPIFSWEKRSRRQPLGENPVAYPLQHND